MFLGELQYPVIKLPGVGPVMARDLAKLNILNVADLLRHYPTRYEDRKTPVSLLDSTKEKAALTIATVIRHEILPWKKGGALKVIVADETAEASLLCFGRNFLAKKLAPGTRIWLTGTFEARYGERQTSNFFFEHYSEEKAAKEFNLILPIYPLSGSLSQKILQKIIRFSLQNHAIGLRNELPSSLLEKQMYRDKVGCLKTIHFPPDLPCAEEARKILVFEELFHLQLSILRHTNATRSSLKNARPWDGRLIEKFRATLPFLLTPDQETSLKEIQQDISSPHSMARLLQGEVGSGKTLVAFMTCLGLIGTGKQAAFMAPTELLAQQHAENASRLLQPLGIRSALFIGDLKEELRQSLLKALAEGAIDLIIGTHALFGENVHFKNLGITIIDEQQRFGVGQRQALLEKGISEDFLALSATPIPRTLALTAFGDMNISSIRSMPKGRLPIETHLARLGNEDKVYDFVRRELKAGKRAYFVYPLIEESDKSPLKGAQNMFHQLSTQVFPEFRAALLHSHISPEESYRVMQDFREGRLDMLVSTSVVEVGVDIPQATCMVVEHAERFGLSALHQLRGRVGRGDDPSYCFLLYAQDLTDEAKKRLMIMKENNDGFVLAEEDLKMRGPGDIIGQRQSGFFRLRIADLVRDLPSLLEARKIARDILVQDPGFLEADNRNLHDLFSLAPPFDTRLLAAG